MYYQSLYDVTKWRTRLVLRGAPMNGCVFRSTIHEFRFLYWVFLSVCVIYRPLAGWFLACVMQVALQVNAGESCKDTMTSLDNVSSGSFSKSQHIFSKCSQKYTQNYSFMRVYLSLKLYLYNFISFTLFLYSSSWSPLYFNVSWLLGSSLSTTT